MKELPPEIVKIYKEIKTLRDRLGKFVGGHEALNKIIIVQRNPKDKYGHGFKGKKDCIWWRSHHLLFLWKSGSWNSQVQGIPWKGQPMNFLLVKGLKHNLLGISQLCDNGYNVTFNKDMCIVQNKDNSLLFSTKSQGNLYKIKLGDLSSQKVWCLLSVKEHHLIWLKKLGYASLRLISKLQKHSLVRGLPKLSYQDDSLCEACQKGKQVKSYFIAKKYRLHF